MRAREERWMAGWEAMARGSHSMARDGSLLSHYYRGPTHVRLCARVPSVQSDSCSRSLQNGMAMA